MIWANLANSAARELKPGEIPRNSGELFQQLTYKL